jgi:hypothetical protein
MLTSNNSIMCCDAEPADFRSNDGYMSAVTTAPASKDRIEGIVRNATYSFLFGLARPRRLIDGENIYEFVLV